MRCILYVDDESNDRLFFSMACQEAGVTHELKLAEDGKEAKTYLEEAAAGNQPERYPVPELVLLDIKMPAVSGLEVLGWMHGEPVLQRVPVVMISSSAEPGDIEESYRLGARAFVTKPVEYTELVEVAVLLKGWLKLVTPRTVRPAPVGAGREPDQGQSRWAA